MLTIFICNISLYYPERPAVTYRDGEREFSAKLTSAACFDYIIHNGYAPDIIIPMCTQGAVSRPSKDKHGKDIEIESYKYFQDQVKRLCEEVGLTNHMEFEPVYILPAEEKSGHFGKALSDVWAIISRYDPADTRIIIDTAGGMRTVSLMLQAVIDLLRYYGYSHIEPFYTNYTECKVTPDNTQHQFHVIEGLAEFSDYGRAEKLAACFANNNLSPIQSLISGIQAFSEAMQLFQMKKLPDILNRQIFPALDSIESMDSADEDVLSVQIMAAHIREKFGYAAKNGAVTVPSLIRWLISSNSLHQAVTLFVEGIPVHMVQTGFLKADEKASPGGTGTRESRLLYTNLIDGCLPYNHPDVTRFKELLKTAVENGTPLPTDESYITEYNREYIKPEKLREINACFRKLRKEDATSPVQAWEKIIQSNAAVYTRAEQIIYDIIRTNRVSDYKKIAALLVKDKDDNIKFHKLLGIEKIPTETERKITGIQNFSLATAGRQVPDIQLNMDSAHEADFRKFLLFYIYIKQNIRNYLNHASYTANSNSGVRTPEHIALCHAAGIQITLDDTEQIELNTQDIYRNLETALELLEKCTGGSDT